VPGQPSGAGGSGDGRKTDVKPTALKQEDLSIQITTVARYVEPDYSDPTTFTTPY
jgi:hypothetical protein